MTFERTALWEAIKLGDADLVKLLIEEGADVFKLAYASGIGTRIRRARRRAL